MIKKITFFLLIASGLFAQKGTGETLPIELLYFYGEASGDSAELYWGTATEFNNYGFEIQRTGPEMSFSAVGFVEGHGNSFSPKDYKFTDPDLPESGTYYYRLKQIDTDGSYAISDTTSVEIITSLEEDYLKPSEYELNAYPNPFNPSAKVSFRLAETGEFRLALFSALGEELTILAEGYNPAGEYEYNLDGGGLASGIYYIRLITDKTTLTHKIILLK